MPFGYHLPVADNILDRQFIVKKPNQVYVGDITYIHTREGWLYLAVVIDLYSRQVVGWSMDGNIPTGTSARQVGKRCVPDGDLPTGHKWKRKPDKGLLWHTDRGSQYASDSHRKLLKLYGIRQSTCAPEGMSRKGNCWDNAVSESFFHLCPVGIP